MFKSKASGDFGRQRGLERWTRREDALGEGQAGTQGSAKRNTCAPLARYCQMTLPRIAPDEHGPELSDSSTSKYMHPSTIRSHPHPSVSIRANAWLNLAILRAASHTIAID
jgi:hypothetical protein